MPPRLLHLAALAVLAAVSPPAPLPAQAPSPDNAGFGALYVDVPLDAQTGNVLHLGVAGAWDTGHLFVSATGPGGRPPHLIYEFDEHGAFVGSFLQPAPHNLTVFGIRDLDYDGVNLLGGSEAGISVFSPGGSLAPTIETRNGSRPVAQPIGGAALAQLGTIRALAFDPRGNGGNGSFLVANLGSPILECDLAGNVLRSLPNGGWTAAGLALDPVTGNLWVNATLGGGIAEIDRVTGALTGHAFAPPVAGGDPGGLSMASGAADRHELWESQFLLASVTQAAQGDDRLAVQRVHLLPGVRGYDEPVLQASVNGGALARTGLFRAGDTIELRAGRRNGIGDGLPCWTILNFGQEAALDFYTDLSPLQQVGYLVEQRTANPLSVPAGTSFLLAAHTLGVPMPLHVPPSMQVQDGDLMRMQSVYLEPASLSGFASTNEVNLSGRGPPHGIVVAATGPNSFQSNPATPFWSIVSDTTHAHGAITMVEFSFAAAVDPAASLRFDIDQSGVGDRFDGGNSTRPGCRGTYRNGCDAACGLDYAAPGVYVDPNLHGPGESAGAEIVLAPGFSKDASVLRFRFTAFTPGNAFVFDCDTDGGLPSGRDHAGMVVRIETTNSGTLVGTLQADPLQPDRAYVHFP